MAQTGLTSRDRESQGAVEWERPWVAQKHYVEDNTAVDTPNEGRGCVVELKLGFVAQVCAGVG